METKEKICPKCGQEDGSGQNHIHDMNPEHFNKCYRGKSECSQKSLSRC